MTALKVVVSLSGGMDSSSLVVRALALGMEVTAVSFDYGQKHRIELEKAQELIDYLKSKGFPINYQVVKLDGLSNLINSSLIEGGEEVPEGHYEDSNMKETVVPNRNKIFASIIQAVSLSLTDGGKEKVLITLGLHSGDHEIYPDTTVEFRDADYKAFVEGNYNAEMVEYHTPYMDIHKDGIIRSCITCCNKLGLDWREIYSRTHTSYKPIEIDGVWYSDYKSASSVERIEAFIEMEREDPIKYADKTGPVSWETVVENVKPILEQKLKENAENTDKTIS